MTITGVHPYAARFPMLGEDELAELADSIANIDYIIEATTEPEKSAFIQPLLSLAYPTGDSRGVDRLLGNWRVEDLQDMAFGRYRLAAAAMAEAREVDHSVQVLVSAMRAHGALTVAGLFKPQARGGSMTAKLLEFAGDRAGYLTPSQAADYLPYTPKTIREMCAAKQITCLVTGSTQQARYRIHRSDIRAWLVAHTVKAVA